MTANGNEQEKLTTTKKAYEILIPIILFTFLFVTALISLVFRQPDTMIISITGLTIINMVEHHTRG